jgi:N-acetyltransferase
MTATTTSATATSTATDTEGWLPAGLVAAMLRRLGLPESPEPNLATLERLYERWCAFVPYDNGRIRQGLAANPGDEVVGVDPVQLLADNVTHGRASQCTETAEALYVLLRTLGFDTWLCLANYNEASRPPLMVNHISVLVRVDGESFLVDTVMLTGRPVPLREHEALYAPLPYRVSRDPAGTWRIDSVTPLGRSPITCRLFVATTDRELCAQVYRNVQDEGFAEFNAAFYAKRNDFGEIVSWSASTRDRSRTAVHRTTVEGTDRTLCTGPEERQRILTEQFGFSPEFVAALPADAPPS